MTNSTPGNDDQRQALSSLKFIRDRKRRVSTVGTQGKLNNAFLARLEIQTTVIPWRDSTEMRP